MQEMVPVKSAVSVSLFLKDLKRKPWHFGWLLELSIR
jgi:hypothetical protein